MTTNEPCPHHSIVQLEQGDKITTQCTRCGKKMKVRQKADTDTPRTDACQKCNGSGTNEVWVIDIYETLRCNECMPATKSEKMQTALFVLIPIAIILTILALTK